MTICIAAIAKQGEEENIVFATDHMVSTRMGNFEHPTQKFKTVNDKTVVMLAGNPLLFNDLTKIDNPSLSYGEIKTAIHENFKNKKKDIIQKELLDPLGVEFNAVIPVALMGSYTNEIMLRIMDKITRFKMDTSILLIGFDENKKAQLTEIREDNISDFRMFNFHAIGSGNMQAMNTLLFQKHDRNEKLRPTIYSVYKAKRNAEVLEGVGKETDLFFLNYDRGCADLSEHLSILKEIYENELSMGKSNEKLLSIRLEGEKCI